MPLSRSEEGTKLISNPAGCWSVPQKFSLLSDRFMLTEGCGFLPPTPSDHNLVSLLLCVLCNLEKPLGACLSFVLLCH